MFESFSYDCVALLDDSAPSDLSVLFEDTSLQEDAVLLTVDESPVLVVDDDVLVLDDATLVEDDVLVLDDATLVDDDVLVLDDATLVEDEILVDDDVLVLDDATLVDDEILVDDDVLVLDDATLVEDDVLVLGGVSPVGGALSTSACISCVDKPVMPPDVSSEIAALTGKILLAQISKIIQLQTKIAEIRFNIMILTLLFYT